MTAQFRNVLFDSETFETLGDRAAESLASAAFVLYCIAQNVADFLFHRTAMAGRTALKLALDRVFQVANENLGPSWRSVFHSAIMLAYGQCRFNPALIADVRANVTGAEAVLNLLLDRRGQSVTPQSTRRQMRHLHGDAERQSVQSTSPGRLRKQRGRKIRWTSR